MTHRTKAILFGILLGIALLLGSCGILNNNAEEAPEPEAVAVRTARADRADLARSISFTARVEPRARVDKGAEVPGEVREVLVSEGDVVEGGDLLVVLDSEQLEIQVRQARSQLASAQANLEEARDAYETAQREVDRIEPLYRQGAISRQAWDSAQDDLEAARRAVEHAAPAAVSGARASLEAAEKQREDTRIRAPISGEVAIMAVSVGEQVGAGNHIATITDRSAVEIRGVLSERQVVQVDEGMPARVEVAALPDVRLDATIHRISSVMDPGGSGFPTKVFLDHGDERLRTGMAAEVFVEVERAENVVVVPVEAVVDREEDPAVFVIDSDDTARRRPVETGLSNRDQIEIVEGLDVDEPVVVSGQSYLVDGTRVRVTREDGDR